MAAHNQPFKNVPARERILRTAYSLFYREGVRATGIDKVIAEAKVTKVTFYRHFRSKDDLIKAFLDRRHELWVEKFSRGIEKHRSAQNAAQRQRDPLAPVLATVSELMQERAFRGCAFINTSAEVGHALPDVLDMAAEHKQKTAEIIRSLLAGRTNAIETAWAATLAVDGAIVNAQWGRASAAAALKGLRLLLRAIT
jgi:AcrR family transcriptional regulator